jgi:IS5 family transposase
LIQESLAVAHKTGALAAQDLERVVVDTTVQPKVIAHPSDARLYHRALAKLVARAHRNGVPLRQSYARVAKRAAIMVGRYSHAHQFKRARRELKFLRTRNPALTERFADLLALAVRVRFQDHRQRGPKVYALHAPEVEQLTGVETRRIHVDRGYRGHNHRHKFRVWITGQVRRVTARSAAR